MASGQTLDKFTTNPSIRTSRHLGLTAGVNKTSPVPTDFAAGLSTATELPNDRSQEESDLHLDRLTEVSILVLSALVLVCSFSALLVCCRGPRPALLVHFRSLRVCDLLMAVFGMSKMGLVHKASKLQINFFTADSLFQAASIASCLALVALHGTVSLQLAQPNRYSKLDQRSSNTLTVLLWNVALVVGFLPLLTYQGEFTVCFYTFYSQTYLLVAGLLQAAALVASLVLTVLTARLARRQYTLGLRTARASRQALTQEMSTPAGPESISREEPNVRQQQQAVALDNSGLSGEHRHDSVPARLYSSYSAPICSNNSSIDVTTTAFTGRAEPTVRTDATTWESNPSPQAMLVLSWARIETGLSLVCSLPFLLYLGLTCPSCTLGDRSNVDSAVLYFIPVFLVRALLCSCVHLYFRRRRRSGRQTSRRLIQASNPSYTNPAFETDDQDVQTLTMRQLGTAGELSTRQQLPDNSREGNTNRDSPTES